MKTNRFLFRAVAMMAIAGAALTVRAVAGDWVGSWATAPQLVEKRNLPEHGFAPGATLRQNLRLSAGGEAIRLRVSNEFGRTPLLVSSVHVAVPVAGGAIAPATDHVLLFSGRESVSIPAGAFIVSDELPLRLPAFADLSVTMRLGSVPGAVTGHPGSRSTSFLEVGADPAAKRAPAGERVEHWYFIKGVEVREPGNAGAVAMLGDSITDGRGSTTDGNDRWPDQFARRIDASGAGRAVGVLNLGIGGNRLLNDGLGPNALSRLDRDVFAQPGVRWLIVAEGVNDIGTAAQARQKGEPGPGAADVIQGLEQIALRAHAQGLRVYGATIMPFGGSFYDLPGAEAERQSVNAWIRTAGCFDAVIDFDAAVRDPGAPSRLRKDFDCGDHLHPTPAGYKAMADAVDPALLRP